MRYVECPEDRKTDSPKETKEQTRGDCGKKVTAFALSYSR